MTILKDNLSKVLPQYMIPSIFQEIERFPLGSNGKIDRKKILINLAECELKRKHQFVVQKMNCRRSYYIFGRIF